jgi:tetratricopeptide (TPR) repeat protein
MLVAVRFAVGLVALLVVEPSAFAAEDRFARGLEAAMGFRFVDAVPDLRAELAECEPGSDRYFRASYLLAVSLHQQVPAHADALAEATAIYERLWKEAGDRREAARAGLGLGRLADVKDLGADEVDQPTAWSWYRRVISRWPDDPVASEATLRLAESLAKTLDAGRAAEADAILTAWLVSHPQDPIAPAMYYLLGDIRHQILGDTPGAIQAFLSSDASGAPAQRGWTLVWRIAVLAEESGDRDLAIRMWRRLVTGFPSSGRAFEAQLRLRRLGVEPPPLPEVGQAAVAAATGESPAPASTATPPAVPEATDGARP